MTHPNRPAAEKNEPKSRPAKDKDDSPMTLQRLRHDIRNYLNAIKLSCALLHRQSAEPAVRESSHEIEKSADRINDLVTDFMGDSEAAKLLEMNDDEGPLED